MNDQPQVDNPQKPDLGFIAKTEKNLPKLESKKPGLESGSTILDLKKISDEQRSEDDQLVKTLMQGIQDEKPPVSKNSEPKIQQKRNVSQQQGFLMPFVNGINSLMDGIWNALKSLIPMKPQTGAG